MSSYYLYYLEHTQWLDTRILHWNYFFISLRSFVHVWNGFVIFLLLAMLKVKRKWLWLSGFLFACSLTGMLPAFFTSTDGPEAMPVKMAGTLVFGITGGIVAAYSLNTGKRNSGINLVSPLWMALFTANTFAFFWTGLYQYRYAVTWINSSGLNYWAYGLWLVFGTILLLIYNLLKTKIHGVYFLLAVMWINYFMVLLIVEYIGYSVLNIHEIGTSGSPLIFGLIHGNAILHGYYLAYPVLVILFYEGLLTIIKKATTLRIVAIWKK